MEQQIADLLRQNQDLIRALQIRDDSHSHKVTVQFDKFDEENENFDSFIERFETYLDVQNVPIANRAKVFVSSFSAKLYQLLKNLLAPDIPSDQTLDKLKDALKKHLTPKPLIIPSRHNFLNRKQTEGEGVSTYIAELRALAMNCDYDKDMLNIMLRDVFVSGLRDKMILDRLFEEDNINLEKTLNIALAMEKAFKGTNDIMGRAINSMQTFKKHMDKKSNFTKSRKENILYCSRCTGEINNYEAKLKLRHGVKPIFCRVRTVPFALKGRVENEIDRLEKEGIIEKVDSSEWATPVVPVVKSDGSIRLSLSLSLCADYSVTLNPNLIVPQHPLPRLDEIFGSLNGGKQFTKLDFKHVYLQMKVHPDTNDASPVGIGCVLSHVYPDGSERPIAFASRTLSGSEKKYSQIDKEALSIVWAVRKFYLYLKGRRFTLITDHKPLIAIFWFKRGLPVLAATRLLHYALILQSFEFDIIFRKTIEHGNADFLSRFPKTSEELAVKDDITIFQMSQIEALPVTSKELRQETSKDIELGPLFRALREGKDLQGREAQYTTEDGCIMYGQRVCIFQGNFGRTFWKNYMLDT
ncbi:uncharacterized protein K02A2.6 [Trichonephila clavipes]|nr:uncharacterized protein K02A2.6 [Trichonephila clavipes]